MDDYKVLAYGKNKVDIKDGEDVIGFRIVTTEDETKRDDWSYRCLGNTQVDYMKDEYDNLTCIPNHECPPDKSGVTLYYIPPESSQKPYQSKPTQQKPTTKK